MLKVIIILLFFSFYLPSNSSPKDKIISQMKLTNNLSFNFLQTINDKNEVDALPSDQIISSAAWYNSSLSPELEASPLNSFSSAKFKISSI